MSDPQDAAKALLENTQFMELFQKALSGGGEDGEDTTAKMLSQMPKEGDPRREAWLRDLQEKLHQQAMQESKKELEQVHTDEHGQWMYVLPDPGFCIKCAVAGGGKVFINICQHERIGEPVPMADAGDDEEVKFRIPISCGQARPEKDKSGKPCKVYDVIVNPSTIARCRKEHEFRRFVAALSMQWIKQKSEPTMNADEFRNLNFVVKGKLEPQRIRLSTSVSKNAMGDEIKLPSSVEQGTAPTVAGGTQSTRGPLVQEVSTAASNVATSTGEAGVNPSHPTAADPRPQAAAVVKTEAAGIYDWSRHTRPSLNPFFKENVPAVYHVELFIPNVQTIKEVDVRITPKKLQCFYVDDEEDNSEPFLTVVFDYPVSDDVEAAKFVRKTHILKLSVPVLLPDESMPPRTAPERDATEVEEEEQRAAEAARQQLMDEQRERQARHQEEEKRIMDERKAYVENLSAVQSGDLPPALREEIEAMPKDQLPIMLGRLEGRVKKGDSIDVLFEKLPEPILDALIDFIRNKLSLEPRRRVPVNHSKKSTAVPSTAPQPGAPASTESPSCAEKVESEDDGRVEFNYAKKSEKLFGVEFHNRYLFALDA